MPSNTPELTYSQKSYYKNGKNKQELELYNKNGELVDGMYFWYDEETQERIKKNLKDNEAIITKKAQDITIFDSTLKFIENTFKDKFVNAISSIIFYEEIDNEKCYVVRSNQTGLENLYYFRISDGMMIKQYFPNVIMYEGDKLVSNGKSIIFKNFKLNCLTEEEISKPELTGCEIIDNRA